MLRKERVGYQVESMAARKIAASAACERTKRVVEAELTAGAARELELKPSIRFADVRKPGPSPPAS